MSDPLPDKRTPDSTYRLPKNVVVVLTLFLLLLVNSAQAFSPARSSFHPTSTAMPITSFGPSLYVSSRFCNRADRMCRTPLGASKFSLNEKEAHSKKHRLPYSNHFSARKCAAIAVSAIMGTAAVLSYPHAIHAMDLASLSGGASSLASSTNSFVASLSETGFYQAFSLVFVSEIGDKTFFIAGLLAMKTSKLISFLGSMSALFVMTLISVLIGQAFHAVPSGFLGGEGAAGLPLDDIAAVLAFAFFGYKTLKEALEMDNGTSAMDEELAEAEEEVEGSDATKQSTIIARILSIFGLVFAAEFGDRSFLSTIALSAAQNPASVAAGAVAAHAVATGIAVSGGAVVAKYLSEKVIGIIGGSLFIVFAITTALGIF